MTSDNFKPCQFLKWLCAYPLPYNANTPDLCKTSGAIPGAREFFGVEIWRSLGGTAMLGQVGHGHIQSVGSHDKF